MCVGYILLLTNVRNYVISHFTLFNIIGCGKTIKNVSIQACIQNFVCMFFFVYSSSIVRDISTKYKNFL